MHRGELEAAFFSDSYTTAGLDSQETFTEELLLIVAKNSPVANARDVAGQTVIAFAKGCSYRRVLETWLESCEFVPTRVLELASYHAISACAAAGTGVAIMPWAMFKALQVETLVKALPLPSKLARVRAHLIWRSGHQSTILQSLHDEIARHRGSASA